MRKHVFDGKQYIGLGDFNHLRRGLIREIREKYEPDENGQIHMSDFDNGQIMAYSHIMVVLLEEELHDARLTSTNADELRKNHDEIYDKLKWEWMDGKYVICAKDTQTQQEIYFRKLCGQDGETLAFTTDKRLALEYDDHYHATNFLAHLMHRLEGETSIENMRVMPLYLAYMTEEQLKKLFDAIFSDDDGSGCGQAFSPDAEGRESE